MKRTGTFSSHLQYQFQILEDSKLSVFVPWLSLHCFNFYVSWMVKKWNIHFQVISSVSVTNSLGYNVIVFHTLTFFTLFYTLCLLNGQKLSSGNRSINIRSTSYSKVKDWVSAINNAGLHPPEGWSHPHRFGSYAPPRGLIEDGSQAQWFIDGKAAFEAIASAIESAKSEVYCSTSYISSWPQFVQVCYNWLLVAYRYILLDGGFVRSFTWDVHFTITAPPGLMHYLKLKLNKVFRCKKWHSLFYIIFSGSCKSFLT